jgi:hypothetical protein
LIKNLIEFRKLNDIRVELGGYLGADVSNQCLPIFYGYFSSLILNCVCGKTPAKVGKEADFLALF